MKVEYDHARYKMMLGASPDDPRICLLGRRSGTPESLILNWYTVDRLRAVDVEQGIDVLTSLLTGPVGFTTDWTRFLGGSNFPYVTHFTVEPDQSISVGGKNYDVRVIRDSHRPYEDGETWIAKDSLLILKYVDNVYPAKSYTVTDLIKAPVP